MAVTAVTAGPTSGAERTRRSRARRRARDAAIAQTLLRDATGESPADALRAAAVDALASGRPGAVDALVPVAGVLLAVEKIDMARRRNRVEGAKLIPASTVDTWHGALVTFGQRLAGLVKTLPAEVAPLSAESEVEAVLQREVDAALVDLQTVVDRLSGGEQTAPAAHPRAA